MPETVRYFLSSFNNAEFNIYRMIALEIVRCHLEPLSPSTPPYKQAETTFYLQSQTFVLRPHFTWFLIQGETIESSVPLLYMLLTRTSTCCSGDDQISHVETVRASLTYSSNLFEGQGDHLLSMMHWLASGIRFTVLNNNIKKERHNGRQNRWSKMKRRLNAI